MGNVSPRLLQLVTARPDVSQHKVKLALSSDTLTDVWLSADFKLCGLQLLFLCGVAMTIGPAATVRFFMRRKNHKVSLQTCCVLVFPCSTRGPVCS